MVDGHDAIPLDNQVTVVHHKAAAEDASRTSLERLLKEVGNEVDVVLSKHKMELQQCLAKCLRKRSAELLPPLVPGRCWGQPVTDMTTAGDRSKLVTDLTTELEHISPAQRQHSKEDKEANIAMSPSPVNATEPYPANTINASKDDDGFCPVIVVPGQPDAARMQQLSPAGSSSTNPKVLKSHSRSDVALTDKAKKSKKKKTHEFLALIDKTKAQEEQTFMERLTSNRLYEWFSAGLIFFNTLWICFVTEYQALASYKRANAATQDSAHDEDSFFLVVNVLFVLLFTGEMLPRWMAEGVWDFFRGDEACWNFLDAFVVGFSWIDIIFELFVATDERDGVFTNVSALRLLRIVRIVRIAKVIRVMRFFRELRMMIFSILGSVKSLVWVVLVLAIIWVLFGIMFTSAVTEYMVVPGMWLDPKNQELIDYFGTLERSVISLFMAMSGGNDWAVYYFALSVLPVQYLVAFTFYITVTSFAIINIVTGVFVETAIEANARDRTIIVHEELESKKAFLSSLRSVFEEMDDDSTGCLSMEEFERRLDDERVQAYFNAMKLDVSDARTLFNLIDYDQSGEVGLDEFLEGCFKLQGESRSLDMKIMQVAVKHLIDRVHVINATMKREFDDIMTRLQEPGSDLSPARRK
eukprot:TRINITY_DN49616_c0_g1_i1.p1 TRINITY_DN49616_c0_g1~~TRINITY_DN49616_c0_g1_i1.p1  ORF type:complete len:639 (-),score=178.81 TRINITY_DN49616_c0_g1_i1:139-2055(-)